MGEISFFMIVTPRDAVIADYAVKSYGKIKNLDYSLLVYSNYLLPEQKQYYFPRWERNPRVKLLRNDHHDADIQPIRSRIWDDSLEGPFEYCDPLWDRELRKIDAPLVATVDADFEILNPKFVYHMVSRLRASDRLIGFSTDYSPIAITYEPYKGHNIILNERNHTWFCIYKREAFELSQVSHAFYKEILPSCSIKINAWDSSAFFQKSLRDMGYEFGHLQGKYRRQFIHYGAFSKNTSITRRNVRLFRAFALVENWIPWRISRHIRRARTRLLPTLENDRYRWVREEPIRW
jgi:hypothetical protein